MSSIITLIQQDKQFFDNKNYTNAYHVFTQALSIEEAKKPEGPYVYRDLFRWEGLTEMKTGMYDKAIKTLDRLLKIVYNPSPELIYFLSLVKYYYSFFL